MTTGRINQVTILNAPRGTRDLLGRQSCTLKGCRSTGSLFPGARLHGDHPTIHLPPLSSPQDGPPHSRAGQGPFHSVAYAPQEEDTGHWSHPKTATSLGLPPSVY
jgi:hypothetical protein